MSTERAFPAGTVYNINLHAIMLSATVCHSL